ncbi:MAG: glutaredoxin [Planctomycetes bacterium]|jgi:monothiol glutaredoxin|nr:glutaredoxin [Planctomycetota bacterium]MDP6409682.1 glutaredoxin domain-containing protein [Planctomycetota bacterium]
MNTEQIKEIVESHPVVVFAKGSKLQPMCGFSAHAMEILNRTGRPYEVVNIFDEEDTRANLVSYSSWPTTPQVFIGGELVGGSDIVEEEFGSGTLQQRLETAFGS